jgi:hypothetical protein
MKGVCDAMPMRHEAPWRDSRRKKRAISRSFYWKVLLLMVDRSNTQYICDKYVYFFTVEISSLVSVWLVLFHHINMRKHCKIEEELGITMAMYTYSPKEMVAPPSRTNRWTLAIIVTVSMALITFYSQKKPQSDL